MTRRDLLKRLLLVPFIPSLRITNRYQRQYGLFNPQADLARQYAQSRMRDAKTGLSVRFIQQWNVDADQMVSRIDVRTS